MVATRATTLTTSGSTPEPTPARAEQAWWRRALEVLVWLLGLALVVTGLRQWLWLGVVWSSALPILVLLQVVCLAMVGRRRPAAWFGALSCVIAGVPALVSGWQSNAPGLPSEHDWPLINLMTLSEDSVRDVALPADVHLLVARCQDDAGADAVEDLAESAGLEHALVWSLADPVPKGVAYLPAAPQAVEVERGRERPTTGRSTGARRLLVAAASRPEIIERRDLPPGSMGGDGGQVVHVRFAHPNAKAWCDLLVVHLPDDRDGAGGWRHPWHRQVQASVLANILEISAADEIDVVCLPGTLVPSDPRWRLLRPALLPVAGTTALSWWPDVAADGVWLMPDRSAQVAVHAGWRVVTVGAPLP